MLHRDLVKLLFLPLWKRIIANFFILDCLEVNDEFRNLPIIFGIYFLIEFLNPFPKSLQNEFPELDWNISNRYTDRTSQKQLFQ